MVKLYKSACLLSSINGGDNMDIPQDYKGRYFYHFTHIDNLESIVKNGILCTNEKNRMGLRHLNIANNDIQDRRSQMTVTCKPYGTVHDYVPFYFGSKSLMLLGIVNKKIIDQKLIVYMCVSIDKLLRDNVVFTDKSANTTTPPNFYNDPKDLSSLHWDLIDSNSWHHEGEEKNCRMAEALIHERVQRDWIDCYVVFNKECEEEIKKIYDKLNLKAPIIYIRSFYDGIKRRFFYWEKYTMRGRETESTITGPRELKERYDEAIEQIINKRQGLDVENSTFLDVNDALIKIKNNFCVIEELRGIYQLETDNCAHKNSVSDHTIKVVEKLKENEYYNGLCKQDKELVELSAYFHDIGKGPKSKWADGIQRFYPDHPTDSIPMIERILSKEFKQISNYAIKKICFLVFYHDLIGDIITNGRSKEELLNLDLDENELDMLIAITIADACAINFLWEYELKLAIPQLKEDILNYATICIR